MSITTYSYIRDQHGNARHKWCYLKGFRLRHRATRLKVSHIHTIAPRIRCMPKVINQPRRQRSSETADIWSNFHDRVSLIYDHFYKTEPFPFQSVTNSICLMKALNCHQLYGTWSSHPCQAKLHQNIPWNSKYFLIRMLIKRKSRIISK